MRFVVLIVFSLTLAGGAQAQSLIEAYTRARFNLVAEQIAVEHGLRAAVLPPAHVASDADTVRAWLAARNPTVVFPEPAPEPPFALSSVRRVPRLERPLFEKRHRETKWAYLGSNRLAPADTILTRALRAGLQAHYGDPTKTLTEVNVADGVAQDEYIQFEYWFVLNDTIPLKVMDVNGPLERGVVVASDQRYRDRLAEFKRALLEPVARSARREAFVDYYYVREADVWYRAGFDGRRYFMDRIAAPGLVQGRPVPPTVGGAGRTLRVQ